MDTIKIPSNSLFFFKIDDFYITDYNNTNRSIKQLTKYKHLLKYIQLNNKTFQSFACHMCVLAWKFPGNFMTL